MRGHDRCWEDYLSYAFIALGLLWASVLGVFVFLDFIKSFRFGLDFFSLLFVGIAFLAWASGIVYIRRIRSLGAKAMLHAYWQDRRKEVIFILISFAIFLPVWFFVFPRYALSGFTETIVNIASIPWVIGDQIRFILSVQVKRFVPILIPTLVVSWAIPLYFQYLGFSTVAGWIFRRRKKKKK